MPAAANIFGRIAANSLRKSGAGMRFPAWGWRPLIQERSRYTSLACTTKSVYDEMTYPVSPTAVINPRKHKNPEV
jgi:hypothetical protein